MDHTGTGSEHVDAIVVGSGFGGAVAAARLAQAGQTVTIIERGRRWGAADFPRRPDIHDRWLWQDGRGLFDVRWLDSMLAIQGAGWGGGSLVYANVFARPPASIADDGWPKELRRTELDPYYDLAGTMLEVAPIAPDPATGSLPDRTSVLESMVDRLGVRPATIRPLLAVRFGPSDAWATNDHGVEQRGCAFLGECVLGCPWSAKNSVDRNYLAIAERHGARALVETEVRRLERDDAGWAVWHTSPDDPDGPLTRRTATRVFLAAGAVATVELLLRSRDVDGTLPELSPRLGEGFSGNGDYLATSSLDRVPGDLSTGPTITTTTVLDVWERSRPAWFQVQDGAVPRALLAVIDEVLPLRRARRRWRRLRRHGEGKTIAFLSMGRDSGRGRLVLNDDGQARLEWSNRLQAGLYRAQARVGPAVARIVGSPVRPVASWSLFRKPVTVHPLGGVAIGIDETEGVVDHRREVHGYPGLFVVDGSTVPASTGANPSATILASAEQAVEGVIREITGDRAWRAPEWSRVHPLPVPEDGAYEWMAARRTGSAGDGIALDETMHERGHGASGGRLRVRLEIPGLDRFLADPLRRLGVTGTLSVAELDGVHQVAGELQLLPSGTEYLMRYDLEFADADGDRWTAVGIKSQRRPGPLGRYRGLTTVALTLRSTGDAGRAIDTQLVLHPADVLRNGRSIRGVGFTALRRIRAYLRFSRFFLSAAFGPRSRSGDAR